VSQLLSATAIFTLRLNFSVDWWVHAGGAARFILSRMANLSPRFLLNIKIVLPSAAKDCRLCYNRKNIPVSMPRKMD
jgi:hypothetical protein